MKTIGLLGGMSWESTIPYYRLINEGVKQRLGGLHSAKLVLFSVDFQQIEELQRAGDWQQAGEILGAAARSLRLAGAEVIVVCTNTMHKVAQQIETLGGLPLLHIADATAQQVTERGVQRIGLLGTQFTMEQDFYRGRLEQHGLEVLIPEEEDRQIVHRIIYEELCLGVIRPASRAEYRRIIRQLERQGAEGVILGCTEITLLVGEEDSRVPIFDTTAIHARAAADYALADHAARE